MFGDWFDASPSLGADGVWLPWTMLLSLSGGWGTLCQNLCPHNSLLKLVIANQRGMIHEIGHFSHSPNGTSETFVQAHIRVHIVPGH